MTSLVIEKGRFYRPEFAGISAEVLALDPTEVVYRIWLDGRPIGVGHLDPDTFSDWVVAVVDPSPF